MDNNLLRELHLSVKYFLDVYSKKEASFGLVPDLYPSKKSDICSIAANGFFFASLVIGCDFGWLDFNEGYNIALKAAKVIKNLETKKGWYYHFYNISTGKKREYSELSNIDTSLMLVGLLTAGSYFGKEVLKEAKEILNRIDFRFFLTVKDGTVFAMAEDYRGSIYGHWDRYAEQLILYVLGAASTNENFNIDKVPYYAFIRDKGKFKDTEFICSWTGSLFTYQYSQAFIDFRHLIDENGVNWHENSKVASICAYEYARENNKEFKSFNELSWGLTACATKEGYSGRFGSPPTGEGVSYNDGTVAPTAALTSIVFTPEESIKALNHFYSIEKLVGEYGLKDSYNIDQDFYCDYYISIDKGASMVMIANYLKETVWKYFNSLDIIQNSLRKLGFRKE